MVAGDIDARELRSKPADEKRRVIVCKPVVRNIANEQNGVRTLARNCVQDRPLPVAIVARMQVGNDDKAKRLSLYLIAVHSDLVRLDARERTPDADYRKNSKSGDGNAPRWSTEATETPP